MDVGLVIFIRSVNKRQTVMHCQQHLPTSNHSPTKALKCTIHTSTLKYLILPSLTKMSEVLQFTDRVLALFLFICWRNHNDSEVH